MPRPVSETSVRTIADLVTSDLAVDASEPIARVVRTWEDHPGTDGMAVLEGDRVRYLSRARFFLQLGKRFGYSVFENRPVLLLSEEGSTVDAEMDPVEAISLATQREAERVYDDILVLERGRFLGLVSMRSLLIHHKSLLVNGMAERALLEEKNQQLRELSRAQAALLDELMLELRAPVNTMLGVARTLGPPTSERDPERVAMLVALGQDVVAILNEMQDVSGLERGDVKPVPEMVDVRRLVEQVISGRGTAHAAPRPEAQYDGPPTLFVTDPLFLRRALANLASASRRLASDGRFSLRVSCSGETLVVAARYASLPGAEPLAALLARASDTEDSATPRLGGAAMRIVTLARLARALGGSLSARDEDGQSTLTLSIPRGR